MLGYSSPEVLRVFGGLYLSFSGLFLESADIIVFFSNNQTRASTLLLS